MGMLGDLIRNIHQSVGQGLGKDINAVADPVGEQLQQQQDQEEMLDKIKNLKPLNPLATQAPASLVSPAAIATSSDLRLAQRKGLAEQLSRKGRSSTILTNDTLGASG